MSKELITKSIVLRARNYRESDKILTLFSLEAGKITATLRGCNKPNAKLKFAGQIFCFGEFGLVRTGDNWTVTNVSEIESFFDISKDYDRLSAGACILEICDIILNNGEAVPSLFVLVLKALKILSFEDVKPQTVLIKFLLDVFRITGYELQLNKCQNCGGAFNTHILLSWNSGSLICGLCRDNNCLDVSLPEWTILKMINQTEYDRLKSIRTKEGVLESLIRILSANFSERFQFTLKSLKK